MQCRDEFDADHVPKLTDEIHVRDIHCVSSLLKLYFRELPNPLLTYQLYDKFVVSFVHRLVVRIRSFGQCLRGGGRHHHHHHNRFV